MCLHGTQTASHAATSPLLERFELAKAAASASFPRPDDDDNHHSMATPTLTAAALKHQRLDSAVQQMEELVYTIQNNGFSTDMLQQSLDAVRAAAEANKDRKLELIEAEKRLAEERIEVLKERADLADKNNDLLELAAEISTLRTHNDEVIRLLQKFLRAHRDSPERFNKRRRIEDAGSEGTRAFCFLPHQQLTATGPVLPTLGTPPPLVSSRRSPTKRSHKKQPVSHKKGGGKRNAPEIRSSSDGPEIPEFYYGLPAAPLPQGVYMGTIYNKVDVPFLDNDLRTAVDFITARFGEGWWERSANSNAEGTAVCAYVQLVTRCPAARAEWTEHGSAFACKRCISANRPCFHAAYVDGEMKLIFKPRYQENLGFSETAGTPDE